jgi:hypothetical protein
MKFFDVLFGRPLATNEAHAEHIGVAAGIPIFGLDGLTSAAYGPEAAMALLIPLGLYGVDHYLLPIFGFILSLLTILYFSYRQTIQAYPNGGGSFTVASENLGDHAGLLAAAALMIDYIPASRRWSARFPTRASGPRCITISYRCVCLFWAASPL